MKSLKDFQKEQIQEKDLSNIGGGLARKTIYSCGDGNGHGDDVAPDTNGDGTIGGSGDTIILDTGETGTIL